MLIKINDHRIVASEIEAFMYKESEKSLIVLTKSGGISTIIGPKTLLDEFEKQYNDIKDLADE